ncbi:uncharacterized protein LOC131950454 isoform X2 [Physella acuta]|uniref:uncharacterized protein LOC131950454 isoform X2 n=1 Tax=Physella acuta TaxID=109671 RepID=UPI0027DE84DD|nr:uncharacterized protein LOC131950454 isoform X2 [Physella acuta]
MAPIPEENQDKPPNKEDSEINNFSNPNLPVYGGSDSSDEDNDNDSAVNNAFGGYSLLPQEADDDDENSDDDSYQSTLEHNTALTPGENLPSESLPEAVLSSEAGAAAPTVKVVGNTYPAGFLAKFPDGKIPSYMQLPTLPRDNNDIIWNQKRQEHCQILRDPVDEQNIIKAMSGFSLPTASIPDWAKNLSDEQWHTQVLHRIGTVKNSNRSHPNTVQDSKSEESKETLPEKATSWVAEFPETG